LAGVCYGLEAIPAAWLEALPRRAELDELFERFLLVCAAQAP
jgi:ADP-ribosylglycohydrolase